VCARARVRVFSRMSCFPCSPCSPSPPATHPHPCQPSPRARCWDGRRATITVLIESNATATATAKVDAGGNWLVDLPEQPASAPSLVRGFTVLVKGDCAGCSVNLTDVLFGDVWVCGGQSNMEFSVAEMFDRDRVIDTAGLPGLRLFAVQKNKSQTPAEEVIDRQYASGWVRSAPQTVCGAEYNNDGYNPPFNATAYCGPHCGPSAAVKSFARKTWGYFSAVCFVHGRALLRDTGPWKSGGTSTSWASALSVVSLAHPHVQRAPMPWGSDASCVQTRRADEKHRIGRHACVV